MQVGRGDGGHAVGHGNDRWRPNKGAIANADKQVDVAVGAVGTEDGQVKIAIVVEIPDADRLGREGVIMLRRQKGSIASVNVDGNSIIGFGGGDNVGLSIVIEVADGERAGISGIDLAGRKRDGGAEELPGFQRLGKLPTALRRGWLGRGGDRVGSR